MVSILSSVQFMRAGGERGRCASAAGLRPMSLPLEGTPKEIETMSNLPANDINNDATEPALPAFLPDSGCGHHRARAAGIITRGLALSIDPQGPGR
jgi:hypothetical protein